MVSFYAHTDLDHDHEPCAASFGPSEGWSQGATLPLPGVDDAEGARLAEALPFVVDAHVHLFPDRMFDAVWRWFDEHGWPVRYKLYSSQIIEFLRARGVGHMVALHYAHKPGLARLMNAYMADVTRGHPDVTGLATVFPGEPDTAKILEEAFALGLRGVKLHCHVQCFSPDDDALHEVYRTCADHEMPLVMHAGREPRSSAYKCDTHQVCAVARTERVLKSFPKLRLSVPHLGADEYEGYLDLLERYDNLWLDTTMMLADYFPVTPPHALLHARPERIMYGTDFPNLPYAWDREIKRLSAHGFTERDLPALLGQNALKFFSISNG